MEINTNVTQWGHVFQKKDVLERLPLVFEYVLDVYWRRILTEKEKLTAIYSAVYSSPSKLLMQAKIFAYQQNMNGIN